MTDVRLNESHRAFRLDPESKEAKDRFIREFTRLNPPQAYEEHINIFREMNLGKYEENVDGYDVFPCSWLDPTTKYAKVLLGYNRVFIRSFTIDFSPSCPQFEILREIQAHDFEVKIGNRVFSGLQFSPSNLLLNYMSVQLWNHAFNKVVPLGSEMSVTYRRAYLSEPLTFAVGMSAFILGDPQKDEDE